MSTHTLLVIADFFLAVMAGETIVFAVVRLVEPKRSARKRAEARARKRARIEGAIAEARVKATAAGPEALASFQSAEAALREQLDAEYGPPV